MPLAFKGVRKPAGIRERADSGSKNVQKNVQYFIFLFDLMSFNNIPDIFRKSSNFYVETPLPDTASSGGISA